jgi:DNA-binding transcriptional LysR family regulator
VISDDHLVHYYCMRISPDRLLILRSVASEGGVLAAARALQVAPSGVSAHLAALERETGLVLIDRSQRGGQRRLALTVAGTKLAAHAARLSEVLADIDADVATLSGAAGGDVTIAAFSTAIAHLVAPAITALAGTHPAITARVTELDPEPGLAAVYAGAVDVALDDHDLDTSPLPPTGLTYRHLLDDSYRLAIPRDWPEPNELADLGDRPWVDGPATSTIHRVLERLRQATGLPLAAQHLCVEFPAALALVNNGHAVALVPDLALPRTVPADIRVMTLPQLGGRRIGAIHRPGPRGTNPAVAAVLDALAGRS